MKKIISVIAAVLLAGQVSYINAVYASSSQESSKFKHSSSKKSNKDKSAKNKSDKSSSKQANKSIADKKTVTAKKNTSKSKQKRQSAESNDSDNKVTPSTQKANTKATIIPVSNTTKQDDIISTTKTADVAIIPTQTTNSAPLVTPVNHNPVDCLYQLSSASISEKELAEWAQLAIIKSFDYSFDTLETQLQKLKACYTEQGWLGFNDALKQSGNLATIKAQQLTVSCEIEGKLKVNPLKKDQWKITVPLKVVYQNTQEKLTQRLFVEMIVGKKSATQLGVVQIIAQPKSEGTLKEVISS